MGCYLVPVVWLLLVFNLSLVSSDDQIISVGLGFIAPFISTDKQLSFLGKELESVFKLAVEDVNTLSKSSMGRIRLSQNFSDLIKNEESTKCEKAANGFISNRNIVGIIGAFSSSCTATIQQQLSVSGSNMSQLSFASTSIKLTEKKSRFKTLFRTSGNDKSQAQALVDLIKHFRWKRVGMIGEESMQNNELMNEISTRLNAYGIMLAKKTTFKKGDTDAIIDDRLQKIKHAGTRVNLIIASGDDVLRFFKRSKQKKMTGDGWVWIGNDGVSSTWLGSDKDVNEAANGVIAISPKLPTGENLLTLIMSWFGKSTIAYPGRLWKLKEPGISPFDAQVYDAVFTFYHALDNLVKRGNVTKNDSVVDLRSKVFDELKTFKDWSSGIHSIAGGKVYFDVDGNAPAAFDIINYYDGQISTVGTWNETSSGLNLPGGKILWPGRTRKTPTDRGTPGKPLFRIGFIAPLDPGLGILSKHGQELVSAARVAVDIINNDRNQQIELDLKVMDEGLDGDTTCRTAAENLLAYNVIAIVGGYRSSCSIAISKALASSKTPMISYASSASILSDKKQHPYFFRVVPSVYYEAKALMKLISKYRFKEVGIISSKELSSMETAAIIDGMLINKSMSLRIAQRFPVNANADILRPILQKVRTSGSHVNLVLSVVRETTSILQQIKEAQINGKGWVWLGNSGITSELLTSHTELAKALQGFLGVGPSAGEGSIYLNFLSNWLEKNPLKYPGIVHSLVNPSSLPYTPQVFDAINGVALSLSDLLAKKIITYQADQKFIKDKLYEKLKTFSDASSGYPSATGTKSVYFDASQDGPPSLDILNLVDSKWKVIGGYSGKTDRLQFTEDPIFAGGTTVPVVGAGKVMYNVAAFFPKHPKLGPLAELGKEWESALVSAVDWINKNQSIAVGFKLLTLDGGYDANNCGSVSKGLPDDIDLVIGEFRSACTFAIYNQISKRNIPLLSYGATATMFSNKNSYPYLFRTCSSDTHQSVALAELINKLKWDQLGIMSTTNAYGSGLLKGLTKNLQQRDIRITTTEQFDPMNSKRITSNILKLKNAGTGVNLVITRTSDAEKVYQEAFEQGMTGKGWTWLGSDGAVSSTFSNSQHLQHAMQGMVGFRPKSGQGNIYTGVMSKWKTLNKNKKIPYIAQVIDAILAPSIALHLLHTRRIVTKETSRSDVRILMVRKLQEMKDSLSGYDSSTGSRSYFDENQDAPVNYDLVNLNGASWVPVGSFDSNGLHITRNIIWPGGTVNTPPSTQPLDKDKLKPVEKPQKSDNALVAVAVIFGFFGVVVLAFMVYIIHRVRYRHLYMQSDVESGGLFSVLYGHRQSGGAYARPVIRVMTHTNGHVKHETELTTEDNS